MDYFFYLLLGLATGILSGALGIGGGILLIPALMWLGWVDDQRKASGITLAVLAVPVVLPAVWNYYQKGWLGSHEFTIAGWIAGGFLFGAFAGGVIAGFIPVPTLRLLFGLALIFVAVRFLMGSSPEVAAALTGLMAVTLAWLAWYGLRLLGRKHIKKPNLGEEINHHFQPNLDGAEYQI